jgi:hypothetical protein
MKAGVTLQGAASLTTQINSAGIAIDFSGANNCRITGIYFHSTGSGDSNHMIEGYGTGVRIDNNKFDGAVSIHIYFGDPHHNTGVVYSNLFTGAIRGQALYVRAQLVGQWVSMAARLITEVPIGSFLKEIPLPAQMPKQNY